MAFNKASDTCAPIVPSGSVNFLPMPDKFDRRTNRERLDLRWTVEGAKDAGSRVLRSSGYQISSTGSQEPSYVIFEVD